MCSYYIFFYKSYFLSFLFYFIVLSFSPFVFFGLDSICSFIILSSLIKYNPLLLFFFSVYLILSYLIPSYLILSYLILSYLILSYLIWNRYSTTRSHEKTLVCSTISLFFPLPWGNKRTSLGFTRIFSPHCE